MLPVKVSAVGGAVGDATKLTPGEGMHRWPWFLPDGKHLLIFRRDHWSESR